MPTLRIPFPEKETPSLIELRGNRITIGRLADNTIQIRDRTVSAHHVELIQEDDHYRLHDAGATNGVLVNGLPVTDFHLREACKISMGSIECEFDPAGVQEGEKPDPSVALVTRIECEALMRENGEVKEKLAILTEQLEKLTAAPAAEGDAPSVPKVDYDKVVGELATLKETLATRDREIEKLQGHLALLRRDHGRLQAALEELRGGRRSPDETQVGGPLPKPAAAATPAPAPAAPATTPAPKPAAPSAPAVPGLDSPLFVRKPAAAPEPAAASAPNEQPAADEPETMVAASAGPLPKPPGKLTTPAPAAVPQPAAAKAPIPVKPFPPVEKPAVPPPAPKSKPGLPGTPSVKPVTAVPVAKAIPPNNAAAFAKTVPMKPIPKVVPKAVPGAGGAGSGPKGTQKLQA